MTQIKDLFKEHRFPTGIDIIPCIIYLPIGIILAVLRVFIGINAIIAALLLPKLSTCRVLILRVMCVVLGIVVQQENIENRDKNVKIIVSNHVSIFDHLAIHLLTGSISVNIWELPTCLHHALCIQYFGKFKEKDILVKNVKVHLNKDETPIDIQPEGDITSGHKGLLKFSSWPFSLGTSVQPITVQIWRPMDITTSVATATWYSDLFWFLFVPFTVFTIRYLPKTDCRGEESEEEMSGRVEKLIAEDLSLVTTNFTPGDKIEYVKRLLVQEPRPRPVPRTTTADPVISGMARRVKEILPHVPLRTITTDLLKTRNVDITVCNFLEGLVQYTPETIPRPAQSSVSKTSLEVKTTPSTSTTSNNSNNTCDNVKVFPKSAHDRMLSFQERKARLIETARQKYMEKHAINVINSS